MKKAILLLVLILSAASCKEHNVEKRASPDLNLQTQNSDSVAVIDFSVTGPELIADLEKQVNYDFCEDQNFIGKIKSEDSVITFPAFAAKKCDWPNRYKHLINILIDQDLVYIPEEFIKTEKTIEKEILEIIKRNAASNNSSLDFVVQWNKETDVEMVKGRLFQVLSPIKQFYSFISSNELNKKVSQLSNNEMDTNKKKFKIRIGFVDSVEPIPAPKDD